MTWKDILKKDFNLIPQEMRTFGRQTTYMNPPEKLMRYNTNLHPFESAKYVGEKIKERYIKSTNPIEYRDQITEQMTAAPVKIAEKAIMKELDPYMDFMQDWVKEENLQAANKKWSELTHRVMLMVQTALNNLFPTIEEAYRSKDLNGFLLWKGEDYQKQMKKILVDLEAPPTEKEKAKIKKLPKKRDYLEERAKIIEERRKKQ